MRRRFALFTPVLALGLLVAGCAKGTHYDIKPGEARTRLAESEIPVMVFGSTATATETAQRGPDTIIWRVLDDDDEELMRLAAHVTKDGEGSRIATEVLPPMGRLHKQAEKGLAAFPAIAAFYAKVAEEQVDAVMHDREFSMAAITPAMMGATMTMIGQMQQQAMRAASESQEHDRANIQRAYDDDAHGRYSSSGSGSEPKFGEPMDGSEE